MTLLTTDRRPSNIIYPRRRGTQIAADLATESDGPHKIEDFAGETSLHGVSFWLRPNKNKALRVFYFLMWVAMLCAAIILVVDNILTFINYDTRISMTSDIASSLTFPSVTVCPSSFRDRFKVGGSQVLIAGDHKVGQITGVDPNSCFTPSVPNRFPTPRSLGIALRTMGERDFAASAITDFERLFRQCIFKRTIYNCSEVVFRHFAYGYMCHTFNYAGVVISDHRTLVWKYADDLLPVQNVSGPGHVNSLRLRLDIAEDNYCIARELERSYRISIHDQNILPIFIDDVVLAPPGYRTLISVKEVQVNRRKTESSGRCSDQEKLEIFRDLPYTQVFNKLVRSQLV